MEGFLEGNLKLGRGLLKGKIEKRKEKKGNRRIFLFGNKFRSWGVIYICEKGWRKENSEDFFGESS